MKTSIIIPTFKNMAGFQRCLESIEAHTDLSDKEILVIANGASQETQEYLAKSTCNNLKLTFSQEAIGFTKAVNIGLRQAEGEYVVILNDDTILLPQEKDEWIRMLLAPFVSSHSPYMAISGPMKEYCPHADTDFILFFCAMIRRERLNDVGFLDEEFNPGYGEDSDWCARAQLKGFIIAQVPDNTHDFYGNNQRTGSFPLYHEGNVTFKDWPDGDKLLAKNRKLLSDRYAVNIDRALKCDGFMSLPELRWLGGRAKQAKVIVEVGSWHGRSTRALADNTNGVVYAVDTWDGSPSEQTTNHASAKLESGDHAFLEFCNNLFDHIKTGKVIPLRMTSKNAAQILRRTGVQADMVFIDADHTFEAVRNDIAQWKPLVKQDGLLCGHDYYHENNPWLEVQKAVNESLGVIEQPIGTSFWVQRIGCTSERSMYGPWRGISGCQSRKVYDCFPFFNELDLLELRFNELDSVVDYFVISEATKTHGGKDKPLYFWENRQRFAKWLPKVIHITVDEYPALDSWSIERHQRDALMRGLKDCQDDDIILIGDADEIPRAEVVKNYDPALGIRCIEQKLYYYYLNCEGNEAWRWLQILPYRELKNTIPCAIRYHNINNDESKIIRNGGWHFSYLGDIHAVIEKIDASAHQEYNKPEFKDYGHVRKALQEGTDLFGRNLQYKFVQIDDSYPTFVREDLQMFKDKGYIRDLRRKGSVTATISTKDRYTTTLPLAIASIINQKTKPSKLLIFDDGEQRDLREVSPFKQLFALLDDRGIKWEIMRTPRLGQVANHQYALEHCDTEFIWRLDDDNIANPNVLEELLEIAEDESVGAVAGLVHHPGGVRPLPKNVDGKLDTIFNNMNIQWFSWNSEPREVDHLYSTFLVRIESALKAGGYPKGLSVIGHREETMLTYNIKRAGYKVVVTPYAITSHLQEQTGGIRSFKNQQFWKHDEKIFQDKLKEWGITPRQTKLIVLDNGRGDHLQFKMALPEIRENNQGKELVVACCFPEYLEDEKDLTLISIADARLMGEIDTKNVYRWCIDHQWKRPLKEALVEMNQ